MVGSEALDGFTRDGIDEKLVFDLRYDQASQFKNRLHQLLNDNRARKEMRGYETYVSFIHQNEFITVDQVHFLNWCFRVFRYQIMLSQCWIGKIDGNHFVERGVLVGQEVELCTMVSQPNICSFRWEEIKISKNDKNQVQETGSHSVVGLELRCDLGPFHVGSYFVLL